MKKKPARVSWAHWYGRCQSCDTCVEMLNNYAEAVGRGQREAEIIALLKNLIGDREAAIYVDEFIALIKGENK